MWVELIDRSNLAEPQNLHSLAWLIVRLKGRNAFNKIRVYNVTEGYTVTQHVYDRQIRKLTDKEVFILTLRHEKVMRVIQDSLDWTS